MFDNFREYVKLLLKEKKMTYLQLSLASNIPESTIKCFMSGANDSRRIAEKIADSLGITFTYSNQQYRIDMGK